MIYMELVSTNNDEITREMVAAAQQQLATFADREDEIGDITRIISAIPHNDETLIGLARDLVILSELKKDEFPKWWKPLIEAMANPARPRFLSAAARDLGVHDTSVTWWLRKRTTHITEALMAAQRRRWAILIEDEFLDRTTDRNYKGNPTPSIFVLKSLQRDLYGDLPNTMIQINNTTPAAISFASPPSVPDPNPIVDADWRDADDDPKSG
jgi:hypothetical protein